MNNPQDFFALMGCVAVLVICWHVMRKPKGPRGPSPLAGAFFSLSLTKDSFERCNKAFANAAAAMTRAFGRPRR